MAKVQLLGNVAVSVHGRLVDIGSNRQRCVLAALAVEVDHVVSMERLAERVWDGHPPLRMRQTLLNYLSRLRRALTAAGAGEVVRRPGGYALEVDRSSVDLHAFRDLRARARTRADDKRHVVELLRSALELWHGEALTGLGGGWAAAERDRLHRERLDAECDLVDAELWLGRGEDLVGDLEARTVEHPLDERVAAQYLLALHRAGRTADALAHYRRLREQLVEDLGTDPGAAVQDLHRRILAADPALTAGPTGPATDPITVPRQLPAAPAPFVGRREELDRLDTVPRGPSATTVAISAITGAGGIGKTWLAVHWAHRHAGEFPDGQLFVDLRGFSADGAPMDPAVAMRGFLDALGVCPDRIPVDPHAQTALFRSLVAGKRMLLVLDNAVDAGQVLPLLPGSETCTVLVTSRNRLPGLIIRHNARNLLVDALPEAEARALLTDRLGPARIAAEQDAVQELITFCDGFPLALSIVAAHADTRRRLPLAALADELHELGTDALADGDPAANLPAVLSWSRRALTSDQATAFALLGIAPGPDLALPAAASLTGLPPREAKTVLRALEEASLLSQDAHGRYSMHDLIRDYAVTTADHDLTEPVRDAALRRVVDFYLHTAHTTESLLNRHDPPLRLSPPAPGTRAHSLPDVPAALAWLDTEAVNLLGAQHTAITRHRHQTVWNLAMVLRTFHHWRGRLQDGFAMWRAALDASGHLPDPATRSTAHRIIGYAYSWQGRHEEADGHLRQALDLAERHHDLAEQAHTHQYLAVASERREDHRLAREHAEYALDLYRALDRPVWEAQGLNSVGWYAACLGDHDTARVHCRAALTLHRRHHDPTNVANTLDSLGFIDHRTGRHRRAIDYYRQALALFGDHGNIAAVTDTLDRLGHPHAALGQHDRARTVWEQASELYQRQGRDRDAERVQRQLDSLGRSHGDRIVVPPG